MNAISCPSHEELRAYVAGKLDDETSEAISNHLDGCSDCQALIATVDDQDDTLLANLRRAQAGPEYAGEQAFQKAVRKAKALVGSAVAGKAPAADIPEEAAPGLGQLGEYTLLAKLGEGGMGTVYKALQTKLEKLVAVKILPKSRMEDERAVARFEREMKAIGRLSHPNIVQAFDAREIDGTSVLVMEYVDGVDLSHLVREAGPLPVAEACELMRRAALGLQYAHQYGLVHRDIKPSNLMLSTEGQVKILDLGLALLGTGQPNGEEMTGSGQAMGTADYMAPEQCCDSHTVDIRADIYSLGCTLYKVLTGHAPFSGPKYPSGISKMMAHMQEPAPPLAAQRPDVPADLAAAVERMMAKAPDDRFQLPADVAAALAPLAAGADLAKLAAKADKMAQPGESRDHSVLSTDPYPSSALAGTKPSHADSLSRRERAGVRAASPGAAPPRRRPPRWAMAAAAAPLFLIALGVVIWINRTRIEVPDGSRVLVREDGSFHVTTPGTESIARAEPHSQVAVAPVFITIEPETQDIKPGDPLSKTALVVNPTPIEGLRSWSMETIGHRGPVYSVCFSPDEQSLATACADGAVRIWDLKNRSLKKLLLGHDGAVRAVAWSPDGRYLASGGNDQTIKLWDPKAGVLIRVARGHSGSVNSLAWSPDATMVASGASDKSVVLWDPTIAATRQILLGHDGPVSVVAWSKSGAQLLTGSFDGTARIWDVSKAELMHTLDDHEGAVLGVAWSPDNRSVATGTRLGGEATPIRIWDTQTGKLIRKCERMAFGHRWLLWGPDENTIIAGCDHTFRAFDSKTGKNLAWCPPDLSGTGPDTITCAALSPTGRSLAMGEATGAVFSWTPSLAFMSDRGSPHHRPRPTHLLPWQTGSVRHVEFSPDESEVASLNVNTTRISGVDTGQCIAEFSSQQADRVSWSADSRFLLAPAAGHGNMYVWNYEAGIQEPMLKPKGYGFFSLVGSVAWKPNSSVLIVGGHPSSQTVQVWDVATKQQRRELAGRGNGLAWSVDGSAVAVGNGQNIHVYEADSGEPIRTLQGPEREDALIRLLVWSPDGKTLASTTTRQAIGFWDTEKGKIVKYVEAIHQERVDVLSWSEDGETLISGSKDRVCIWDGASGRLLQELNVPADAVATNARLIVERGESVCRFRSLDTGNVFRTDLHLRNARYVAISPTGHFRGSADAESDLVFVVLTEHGQEIVDPVRFPTRFGWKNDPAKVTLGTIIGPAPPEDKE